MNQRPQGWALLTTRFELVPDVHRRHPSYLSQNLNEYRGRVCDRCQRPYGKHVWIVIDRAVDRTVDCSEPASTGEISSLGRIRKTPEQAQAIIKRLTVIDGNGCWLWQGGLGPDGYSKYLGYGGHRISYEAWIGPIPDGLTIDHLCRVRHCVNPKHLEPVTIGVNTYRGDTVCRRNSEKTHCKNGHEFTAANTRIAVASNKWLTRVCRTCARAAVYRYQARKRAA